MNEPTHTIQQAFNATEAGWVTAVSAQGYPKFHCFDHLRGGAELRPVSRKDLPLLVGIGYRLCLLCDRSLESAQISAELESVMTKVREMEMPDGVDKIRVQVMWKQTKSWRTIEEHDTKATRTKPDGVVESDS